MQKRQQEVCLRENSRVSRRIILLRILMFIRVGDSICNYILNTMTAGGVQAWVTSAVKEDTVDKAIVLAGSLRRVRTAKKLAVYTTLAVSKDLREKLKDVFDLVVLLDKEVPNGLSLDDYAKVQAFSLLVFNKCVYLSPDTLVLKNCDEIFEKYATFAALSNNGSFDTSVYVFIPSLDYSRALDKIVHYVDVAGERTGGTFGIYFNMWMQNNIPNAEKLHEKYNLRIDLHKTSAKSLEVDITIANFHTNHPLTLPQNTLQLKLSLSGSIEKYAVETFLQIHKEDIGGKIDGIQRSPLLPTEEFVNEPIAIVGMSFRLPGGNDVDEFWDLLIQGKDAIQPVPPFRWVKEHISIPCKDRKFQAGFLNIPIDQFDAKFFGLSPKEAVFLDPQQRLLHEVCWEAMEDAMIDPLKIRGSQTGVFVGSWIHDYRDIAVRSTDVDFFRVYMGNSIASEAARLSHFLNTTGPSIATESGCSSAIVAVHMACKSLRNHETNMAMACGVNLLIHPQDQSILSFVVAPDGRCKTFDAEANGFGRAEACAVLLLKRCSDAIKDGDNIWGLIRGSAVTQEGVSKSLGTPTVHCESLAMELALRDANLKPTDVSYVEAHGTGTPVGDPMEIAAITKAYGKGRTEPLFIGSVKTNVGHTESVSGITGIIKVLLSMKNETIPQHLNLKTINPNINLDAIPAEIPLTPTPWPKQKNKLRIAGVSSFGISGTDGHAIIQEPPIFPQLDIDFNQERPLHIIKFSAKCQESLDQILSKYERIFVEKAESGFNKDFADIAHSANFGRSTFNHRAVLVAEDFKKAAKIIHDKTYKHADVQSSGAPICFLFTGQGSQYPKMAANLYSTSPIFKQTFDECSNVLRDRYGISINDVLWGNAPNASDELSRTLYSQTSIFCVEYCLLKLWQNWGVKPDFVLGHSLGEFAAAVAAEVLSFDDALLLVAERSRLIDNLHRGKMLVIKADKKTVDQTIAQYKKKHEDFWVDFAALNSPDQTVVAGDSEQIIEFSKFCGERQLKSIVLASTHAFHSRHMDPMLKAYRKVARTVTPLVPSENAPKYFSGVEGKLIESDEIDADYWVKHTREKVNFIDACKSIQSEGCGLFLEVGPHPILSALVLMNIEGQSVTCLPSMRRKEDEWVTLLDSLSKLFLSDWKGEIDWKGFDKHYHRRRVPLPFYPFNRKPMWLKTRPVLADLHPLLGKVLPNASGYSVFEQSLTIKQADFVQDHIIGNTIVFPGAGFLEMCLVGGHSCVQAFGDYFMQPRRPVVLKGLKIKAPLALFESQLCIVQTVASLDANEEEDLGYNVSVSRLDVSDSSNGGQWLQHASAKFLPVSPSLPSDVKQLNIQSMQETWESTDSKDFYEKLPEVGLRFGPKFQSLQNGWKHENGILLQVKVPENINESYIIHPVLADAMIQAAMLWTSKDKIKKKLQVPVHIGTFMWLDSSDLADRFIYCSSGSDGIAYSLLVDGAGKPLAYMSAIDFAETTVKLVEGMIHQQHAAMPHLWEEIWKPTVGPMQRRLENENRDRMPEEISGEVARLNKLSDDEYRYYEVVCQMTCYYFVDALYALEWKPIRNEVFTVAQLMNKLNIQETYRNYVRFFLKLLQKLDWLEIVSNNTIYSFKPTTSLPNSDDVSAYIDNLDNQKTYLDKPAFRLIQEVGRNLNDILIGKSQPLNCLFPTDASKPSAQQFYDSLTPFAIDIIKVMNERVILPGLYESVQKMAKLHNLDEKPLFRILEVGAGTGAFSKSYLYEISKFDLNIEYYYTDVSAAFFGPAEKLLEDYKKNIVFKKFNMDEDPFSQGFCPEYFDCILALEVLHVSKKLRPMLQNLRSMLKPNGHLHFYETTVQCPRITFIFGLLEGYWQFEDHDLRQEHITLSPETWISTLKECGFPDIECVPAYNNVHGFVVAQASSNHILHEPCRNFIKDPMKSWLIFSNGSEFVDNISKRLASIQRKVHTLNLPKELTEESIQAFIEDGSEAAQADGRALEGILYLWGFDSATRDQTQISLPYVSLCQHVWKMEVPPKIFVFTKGVYTANGSEVCDPSPGSLTGIVRSARNEYSTIRMCHMDFAPNATAIDHLDEAFYNLWMGNDDTVAFRDKKRLVPRIASHKSTNEPLTLPNGCDRYKLELPESKMISDLEFTYLDPYILKEKQIEIHTKAFALNFRDVFCVLKPLPIFEKMNSIGLDFAGVISKIGPGVTRVKVGDRVMGMNMTQNLSLPSHIRSEEQMVAHIPEGMTFNEGVTLPAVFSTALHCLVNVANVKRGETLLIHTASGGVGLCAIQLAQSLGVNIIATAGSTAKRNFLRNLGIQHIFNSRTTDFGKQILEVTNGRGVDIVLNSITGPGFKEASLDALTKNGRFIEMSKLSVWTNEEVYERRPDVFYALVDLTTLPKEEYERLTTTLKNYMSHATIRPIAYERFDALNIRGALYYLQKAKHIGKIVCVMPNTRVEKSKFVVETAIFNEESTYLVTGGLGGIGFEVVKWMLKNGAKHVAIASRSTPKPEIASQLDVWKRNGKHVEAFAVDIGNYVKCKELLDHIAEPSSGFPQLRGVMHAAGVLQDATVENQSWEKFRTTYNPKVYGTWNLHDLTKDMLLEHFVLFSSIAAIFGSPGQTNHSAANSFEDALARYRRSIGLPAMSVNWGNWGETGVATEVDIPGIRPISTKQGLLALGTFLTTQQNHVSVANIESFGTLTKLFPNIKSYVADKRLLGETKLHVAVTSDEFWSKVDVARDREEKLEVFKTFIKSTARVTLKMEEEEEIDDNTEFQVLGIDSLMMLEMKNGLQNVLGNRMTLTAAQLKDCNNTLTLANRLVDILDGQADSSIVIPTEEELRELLKQDSTLPETIQVPQNCHVKQANQIETVLLTGVTGTLGPYVLRDLAKRRHIKKIICLIRKSGKLTSDERLASRLERVCLTNEINKEKVVAIHGDITEKRLGMTQEEYDTLAEEVEAVFHCAVRADHNAKYWKCPESKKLDVRTVNVGGTIKLLEFATHLKLKHFYNASTLLIADVGENGYLSENWVPREAVEPYLKSNPGYPLSKLVSELLLQQASERGVPIKVFRLPLITGDSRNGRCDFEGNHALLRWLAYLRLGCMPEVPTPYPLMAVDQCSLLSLDVFFNNKACDEVYNVCMRNIAIEQVFIDVAKRFSINVEAVSMDDFLERLKGEDDQSPLAPFKEFYESHLSSHIDSVNSGLQEKYLMNAEEFFICPKLLRLYPDYEKSLETMEVIMYRDLKYLKDSGVFEKFGIGR